MSDFNDILESAPDTKWTKPKVRQFRKALHKAMMKHNFENGPDNFTFEGHSYMIQFAVYLLTHLEEKFNINKFVKHENR